MADETLHFNLSPRALRTLMCLVKIKTWGFLKGTIEGTFSIDASATMPEEYSTLSVTYVEMFKTSNIPPEIMKEFQQNKMIAVVGVRAMKATLELTGIALELAKRLELRGSAIYKVANGEKVLDSIEDELRKMEMEVTDPTNTWYEPRD